MREEPETIAGDEPGRPQWLAGYRVLRRLGSGSRATVYLAHAGDSAEGVAIKAFELPVPAESLDAEVDALSRVISPHVVRMLDIAIAPGRPPCIVLQRLTGGSLATLLSRGPAPTAGAAVTVLVSIARGLADLHGAGFDHQHVTPTTVLFDGTGRPVLIGLGHTVPIVPRATGSPPAPGVGARLAGLAGLARLVRTVFDHVDDGAAPTRAEELARWLEHLPAGTSTWAAVEDRLFDLAEPEPVLLGGRAASDPSTGAGGEPEPLPVRAALGRLRASGAAAVPRGAAHAGAAPRGAAHVAARDDPPWWARGDAVREAVLGAVRHRRRPLVVAGAAGAALLVLALAVLPVNGGAGWSAAPRSTPAGNALSLHRPASTGTATPGAPTTNQPAAAPAGVAAPAGAASIRADEPVAATDALLALRRACLRTRSPSCLAGVDQDGSAMLRADRLLMVSHGAGVTYEGYETSLIQRSGGSALIALAPPASAQTPKPASALVVEGETGWRLREVFAD